ncbi:exonuclease SbcC domain protein, partial [Escherichia coli O157:H7 str. TW14313]
MAFSHSADRL